MEQREALTTDGSDPRYQYLPANEPANKDQARTPECIRRHRHQLRNSRIGQAQLVYDSGQHGPNTPPADGVAHPDERERGKGRIFEECFHLGGVPGLRSCSGLSFGETLHDGVFFFFAQEFGVGIGEVGDPEKGEDAAEDGRDAFDDEDPAMWRCN